MTRSLDNLFDEPQRSSKPTPSASGGDFDALLDDEKVDSKGSIDPSWDKVRNNRKSQISEMPLTKNGPLQKPAQAAAPSTLEEDGMDDLMGIAGNQRRPRRANQIKGLPPEPPLSATFGQENSRPSSFPWWVVVAAILLILAGAAAVVTFS